MAEVARRSVEVAGKWANGGAVAPATAAVCTMIGLAAKVPPEVAAFAGVSSGALAGAVAEVLVDVNYRLWAKRVDCVDQFTTTAATEAGVPAEDLLRDIAEDPRSLELFAQVAETASRALDGWKIDLLARIFVHGARDGANVDATVMIYEAVRDLQRPHLRVLEILAEPNPDGPEGRWTASQVVAADEGLGDAVSALISKLGAVGLATDTDTKTLIWYSGGSWTLTRLGRLSVDYLASRGSHLAADS